MNGDFTSNFALSPRDCFSCPKVIPNLAGPIPLAEIVKASDAGGDSLAVGFELPDLDVSSNLGGVGIGWETGFVLDDGVGDWPQLISTISKLVINHRDFIKNSRLDTPLTPHWG
ncbi:MAG: hypothetical protein F6K55_46005 [Moorea sp. SIO4A3]|nr:hypothetical protein [Moorena sp. SIO4A3]